VASIFTKFKSLVENLLSCAIKIVQLDKGTEFLPIIKAHPVIQFYVSCPYTPQQNGIVERKHRHIVELSLASMFHANIPQVYWSDVFESVAYIINRLPLSLVTFQISFPFYSTKNLIITSSKCLVAYTHQTN
jgi:hypothetical protein